MASVDCTTHAGDCYWLAQGEHPNIRLVDGCHSGPEGVAKAAKLMGRIFRDKGPWLMVKVEALPDLDPPINEQAANDCAYLVAEFGPSTSREKEQR